MKKYRVVEHKNNLYDSIEYIIEKRRKFLWWEWWSDGYLIEDLFQPPYYYFKDENKAKDFCSKLNGEQGPLYEKKVLT